MNFLFIFDIIFLILKLGGNAMLKKKLLVALLFIFTGVGLLAFGLETVKVINIPDMNLRFAINRNLNKDIDDPITKKN